MQKQLKVISTDSIFVQSPTHKVCQDYALHLPNSVHISDGCSSEKYSDVGARQNVWGSLQCSCKPWLGCTTSEDFAATLRSITISNSSIDLVHIGDGHTVLKNITTGKIIFQQTASYPSNAPVYPRYIVYPEEYKSVLGRYSISIEESDLSGYSNIDINVCEYLDNIEFHVMKQISIDILEAGTYIGVVFSDGIETISDPTKSTRDMIDMVLDLKLHKGEFIQRRWNAIKKYMSLGYDNGEIIKPISFGDDVSIAGIVFEIADGE